MVISIIKFMLDYYGVPLNTKYKYSHKELKKEFEGIIGCTFEYADEHPDLVKAGKILYVKDSYGKVLPYISPAKRIVSDVECEFIFDEHESSNIDILDEMYDMPDYMLGELLSKYKRNPSIYKLIKKELISRGIYANKIYKCAREIDEDEEYSDKLTRRSKIRINKRGRWK